MKKKLIAIIAATFIIGSIAGVAGASAINQYVQMLLNSKDEIVEDMESRFNNKIKEADKEVDNMMTDIVNNRKEHVKDEAAKYMDNKIDAYVQEEVSSHTKEVDKATNDLLNDVKKEIDTMIKKYRK